VSARYNNSKAETEADRKNLKDSVLRITHGAEWLYEPGDSMISLEHVRRLLADPPAVVAGKVTGFCDSLGLGTKACWWCAKARACGLWMLGVIGDTMHSVAKFINVFRKLGLRGCPIGGDEGYGYQLMDRMAEGGVLFASGK
jgi:hypothetical protein